MWLPKGDIAVSQYIFSGGTCITGYALAAAASVVAQGSGAVLVESRKNRWSNSCT